MFTVVVVTGWSSAYPNPITFKAGQSLKTFEQDEEYPGWIRTRTTDGNEGWAPMQYIDCNSEGTATALRDYCAHELSTVIGQRLVVREMLNHWYLATTEAGETGWVPCETTQRWDVG